jgi:hypothetical protein
MAKVTMKSKILDFVESQGAARFTDIQRFIVDHNKGEGTYDAAKGTDTTWGRKCNPYRGYYSVNLSVGGQGGWGYNKPGYIMVGAERLEKGADGLYRTIRG